MANKSLFSPPSTSGYRSVTSTAQKNGDCYNAPRFPEIGGFDSSRKGIKRNRFKNVNPHPKS